MDKVILSQFEKQRMVKFLRQQMFIDINNASQGVFSFVKPRDGATLEEFSDFMLNIYGSLIDKVVCSSVDCSKIH